MKAKERGWNVVLTTELKYLWLRGQAPLFLLIFSIILSGYITLLALDPEMNVLSPQKMTNTTLQITILVGISVVLLLNANAISGERDQRSLESLLLTPLPRGQIALGKCLATLTIWLGMIPVAIPYLLLIARGTGSESSAVVLMVLGGSLLVTLCAGICVLISSLAPTNLISFMTSFTTILVLAAPTQLPSSVQELPLMRWLIAINPITTLAKYQTGILDGGAWFQDPALLLSPIVLLVFLVVWGPKFLNRRLSLLGGLK